MDKLFIIKIGGNVIDDDVKRSSFAQSFAAISQKKILIHGGGKLATRLAEQLNVPQQMVDGRRITDAETLKIVTMVYAGSVNKELVALLQKDGCNALGLSGADGNVITAHKRVHPTTDYGFAGDIDNINTDLLHQFLQHGITPVLAPVTHDGKGQLLNTNADTIAQETAKAMSALYEVVLVYCFEKEGVLGGDGKVVPVIDRAAYKDLKENNTVSGGMIPKLDNAFEAIEKGVRAVIIGSAGQLNDLLNETAGTRIQ
jgi:acetylglutamate kinase